jgi:hypothetical protein
MAFASVEDEGFETLKPRKKSCAPASNPAKDARFGFAIQLNQHGATRHGCQLAGTRN